MKKRKPQSRRKGGIVVSMMLAIAVTTGSLGVSAAAADTAPVNTTPPSISPTTPYLGKQLAASSGMWTSEATAHWYSCDKQGGGKYGSSSCAVAGSPNEWELAQLAAGKSVNVTAGNGQTTKITFSGTVAGWPGGISCSKTLTGTSLENPSGGSAGKGAGELSFSGCTGAGEWSTCTVTPTGGAVPISMDLTTPSGQTRVGISPVSGTLLAMFNLENCQIAPITIKLYGKLTGRYSNANAQIEFDAETTASGMRFQNPTTGPKATAVGTIGLKSSSGGDIKADSITGYSYAWNRCEGKSCSTISGATAQTYTPVVADLGKTLTVTVTASNPAGSTAATSAATSPVKQAESEGRLSFFRCGAFGGTSYYEDANCTKTGAFNSYSWQRMTSASFTASKVLSHPIIDYTTGGVHLEIVCNGMQQEGTLTNTETKAIVSDLKLTLTGCAMQVPECTINGNGTIVFNTLSASSAVSPEALEPKLTVVPKEGAVFATMVYSNCYLSGSHTIRGSLPASVINGESRLITTGSATKATLRLDGTSGPAVGFETGSVIASEGGFPLKLDVAP